MGEQKFSMKPVVQACEEALVTAGGSGDGQDMRVSTPGGGFHVRWDSRGGTTAMGQLPFFAEYLDATGLFEDWLKGCPLSYVSPNAPKLIDVLGTWMLSILDGHKRYAHVGVLRGDGVAPSLLGMNKIVSDDSLRRALSAIAPGPDNKHTDDERAVQLAQVERATKWMQSKLMHSGQPPIQSSNRPVASRYSAKNGFAPSPSRRLASPSERGTRLPACSPACPPRPRSRQP